MKDAGEYTYICIINNSEKKQKLGRLIFTLTVRYITCLSTWAAFVMSHFPSELRVFPYFFKTFKLN